MNKMAHLISKSFRCNDGNFIAYPLVGLEIKCELGVVAFDDDFGRFLHSLMFEDSAILYSDPTQLFSAEDGLITFVRTRPILETRKVAVCQSGSGSDRRASVLVRRRGILPLKVRLELYVRESCPSHVLICASNPTQ